MTDMLFTGLGIIILLKLTFLSKDKL